jgi:hypothetical protein
MSIPASRLVLSLALAAALYIARPAAAQLFGGTTAQDCAAAIAGDVRDHSTVSVVCGIPKEEVAEFIRLAVSGRPGDYADLLRRLDAMIPADARLRVEALARFFTILGEADVPSEHLTDRLVEIAGRYQELLVQLKAASGDDPEVVRLKAEAEAALGRGDLDRADAFLQEVEEVQEKAADRQALELAATKAQRAGLALTRLRYAEAASLFAEAAGRMPPGYEEERLGYLDQETEALYRQSDERGDNAALAAAIERRRALIQLRPRERVPLQWAGTQMSLGNALATLGAREAGTARLEEAVQAYEGALAVFETAGAGYYAEVARRNHDQATALLRERQAGGG